MKRVGHFLRARSGKAPAVFLAGLAIFMGVVIFGAIDPSGSREPRSSRPLTPQQQDWVADFEAVIEKHRTEGLVHSVDLVAHRVRMSPEMWRAFALEDKQAAVQTYSTYFRCRTGYGYVDILSDRNDRKLASWSVRNGIEIHE